MLVQFGFDSRDGNNYASIDSAEIPTGTNARFAGRWVFPAMKSKHQGSKVMLMIQCLAVLHLSTIL